MNNYLKSFVLFVVLLSGCASSFPFKQPSHRFKMIQWLGRPCYVLDSEKEIVFFEERAIIGLCEDGTVVWKYRKDCGRK